jgi:hypothetical protein
MPQPYDYLGAMGGVPNISATVQNAVFGEQQRQQSANVLEQQAMQIAQAKQAQARAEQRQAAMHKDYATLMENPNAPSVGRFMMNYPEAAEGLTKGWEVMNGAQKDAGIKTSADVHGYLSAGDPEGAIKILRSHMEAAGRTGEDVSGYPQAIELIRQDPQHALTWSAINLASAMGPEKFTDVYKAAGDQRRADEKQPYEVQQAAAEASIKGTEAQYKPTMIQSDLATAGAQRDRWVAQTADEQEQRKQGWSRLNLDQDALETQTAIKLQELQQTAGKVPDGALGAINSRVTDSVTSAALASRAHDLAESLRASGARGGLGAGWVEDLKQKTGSQDAVTQLRSEFTQFINGAAIKLLPPGPASDKDVEFVRKGFPKPTDPPEYVATWLDTYARVQRTAGNASERQGNWMAANGGSLGPARSDINVGGVTVRAGTTFTAFNKSGVTQESSATLPAGITVLQQRYGRR